MAFSSTISLYSNKQHVRNTLVTTLYKVVGAVTTAPDTVYLISTVSSLIDDGVLTGDTVKMVVGGETSTVDKVVSNTQMYTTVLSAAGTYAAGEVFYITRGNTPLATGTNDATSSTTLLNEAGATFLVDGVCVGDKVRNLTEGVTATVVSVNSSTQLTTTAVTDWTGDDFFIYRKSLTRFITQGVIAATDAATFVCVDTAATYITDGVRVGDTLVNGSGGNALVVGVDSETQLRTAVLSAAGVYSPLDVTTIDETGNIVMRAVLYSTNMATTMVRYISGVTDGAAAASRQIRIFYGAGGIQEYLTPLGTTPFFFDPDMHHSTEGQSIIVELEVATAAASSLNVSYMSM